MFNNLNLTIFLVIAIANPVIVGVVKILVNYKTWLRKRNLVNTKSMINHTKEWFIMAACSLPGIVILGANSNNFWIGAAVAAGMFASFLWIFFDGGFNVIRGFPFFYTGSGEKTAANTDKFLKRLKLWQHILLKFGLLALFITLYILFK